MHAKLSLGLTKILRNKKQFRKTISTVWKFRIDCSAFREFKIPNLCFSPLITVFNGSEETYCKSELTYLSDAAVPPTIIISFPFVIAASDCRAVRKYPISFHESFSKEATFDDMHQSIVPPII